jgi:Calx-beta domain
MNHLSFLKRLRLTSDPRWIFPFLSEVILLTCLLLGLSYRTTAQVTNRDDPALPPAVIDLPTFLLSDGPTLVFQTNFFAVREYLPLQFIPFRLDSPPGPGPVVVRFSVAGGTATEGEDYWIEQKVFEFEASFRGSTDNVVRLILNDADEKESDETLLLDASIDGVTNAPVRIEVLIRDAQSPGQVGFLSSRFSSSEASSRVEVRLYRTQDPTPEGNVTLSVDGDAGLVAAVTESQTVVVHFDAGASQAVLAVPLVNDTLSQGNRELRLGLVSADSGMTLISESSQTVLTVADDESTPELGQLDIRRSVSDDIEGVIVLLPVARGFRCRIEYTDSMTGDNWGVLTDVYGADIETTSFDSFKAGLNRMYRATGPFPSDITLPW